MKFSPEYYVNIFQHTVTIPIVPIQEDDEKLCIDLTFSEWELSDYYKIVVGSVLGKILVYGNSWT